MSDTTAGGIQVPTISDDPDVPRDILRVVTDVQPSLVYKFNTTTERNTAFPAIGFKECWVGDTKYVRRGSSWYEARDLSNLFTWQNISFSTNWGNQTGMPTCQYAIVGSQVYFRGVARRTGGNIPTSAEVMFAGSQFAPYSRASGTDGLNYGPVLTAIGTSSAGDLSTIIINPRFGGGVRVWTNGATGLIWVTLDNLTWSLA